MWKTKLQAYAAHIGPCMKKFRYPLLIFLAGLILLYLGAPHSQSTAELSGEQAQLSSVSPQNFDMETFETDLQNKLSLIEGAGQVELLLALEDTEEVVYASDIRRSSAGAENDSYEKNLTVLSDGNYGEQPVQIKSVCPTFRGAVILCEGGDQTTVRLAIAEAVSAACGLSMDKISVLKMQQSE